MPASALRRLATTLAALASLSTLAGCRAADDAGPRELRIAVRADVTGLFPNPPAMNEGFTFLIASQVFEGLVGLDGNLHLVPALAEHWRNPDAATTVFDLREGLRFSDGRPVTARDVAASLRAAVDQGWINAAELESIESVHTRGERRIEIRTAAGRVTLLAHLPRGYVLPADGLQEIPVPPIGTGPYTYAAWEPGQELVLTRNRHYRGPRPFYDSARLRVEPDDARRVALLRRGEVDVVDHVPLDRIRELEEDPRLRVVSGPGNRVLFLCLAVGQPPLADPRVREAIALAIDRDELNRRVFLGRAAPVSQVVPPGIVGYVPDLAPDGYDPGRARRLLAQAGWPDGFELPLHGPSDRYVRDVELLHEVARQLRGVGIRLQVVAESKSVYFQRLVERRSAMHLLGWAEGTGEASSALRMLFRSPTRGGLGVDNTTGLSDPVLDSLIDAADAQASTEVRAESLRRAMRRLAELRPVVPLVVQPEAIALSTEVSWQPPLDFGLRISEMRRATSRER